MRKNILPTLDSRLVRSDRRFFGINQDETRMNENEHEEGCGGAWPTVTHLLSRQQIHSAGGDDERDACTATMVPGCVRL